MLRIPRPAGTLAFAAAYLMPWRPLYRVRAGASKLTFDVRRRDAIGRHIAKYGAHEPQLTAWIARHLERSPPGIVVDAGANIGWHTVHAARHAAVEKVVAFEPDELSAEILAGNLELNNVINVVVQVCALGAKRGLAELHHYKESNRGRHSLVSDHGLGGDIVSVRVLDGVLDDLGLADRRILLLKIDVEGYEPAVIEGATEALARTDVVVLEFSPGLSRDGGLSTNGMIDQLYRGGFKPSVLAGDGCLASIEREELVAVDGQIDLIWAR